MQFPRIVVFANVFYRPWPVVSLLDTEAITHQGVSLARQESKCSPRGEEYV
jgi:hypothetical protein